MGTAIPFPADRSSSSGPEYHAAGADAAQTGPGASPAGTSMQLLPPAGIASWAVYTFHSGNKGPAAITVTLAAQPGGQVWAGAADYSAQRWTFSGPYSNTFTLPLDPQRGLSPGGNASVALLTLDPQGVNVQALDLQTHNQLPALTLDLSVSAGDVPLTVTLTPTGSDNDGTITDVQWDFDGDGVVDLDTGTALDPQTHTYTEPGSFHPTLRAIDNDGDTGQVQAALAVHGWTVVDVFPYGYGSSFALINGKPAMSFVYRAFAGDVLHLAYAQSLTATGSQPDDWFVSDIATANSTLLDADLTQLGNGPAIAFSDNLTCNLRYAYTDGFGIAPVDWRTITVDNSATVGRNPSLALINGAPAIAYCGYINGVLHYARANTSIGRDAADWTSIVVDDSSTRIGNNPSLALVNGTPAIAYGDNYNFTLKYARASTAEGLDPADWTSLTLDAPSALLDYISLAVISGNPALAYHNKSTGMLSYASSMSPDGASLAAWQTTVVDDVVDSGLSCSLAQIGAGPCIAYDWGGFGGTNPGHTAYLKSTVSGAAQPAAWTKVDSITPDKTRYGNPSLAEFNGKPVMSFSTDYGISYAYMQ